MFYKSITKRCCAKKEKQTKKKQRQCELLLTPVKTALLLTSMITSQNTYFLFFVLGPDQLSLLAGGKPPRKNSGLSRVEEVTFKFLTVQNIR